MAENKMEAVAALFGKKLGEEFRVVHEGVDGRKYFLRCYFGKMGLMRNGTESSGGLLHMMLRGEAVIVD
jgi:hypothetical protein